MSPPFCDCSRVPTLHILKHYDLSSLPLSLENHPFLSSPALFFLGNPSCHPTAGCLVHNSGAAKAEKDQWSRVDPPDGLEGLARAGQAEGSQWWGAEKGKHLGDR